MYSAISFIFPSSKTYCRAAAGHRHLLPLTHSEALPIMTANRSLWRLLRWIFKFVFFEMRSRATQAGFTLAIRGRGHWAPGPPISPASMCCVYSCAPASPAMLLEFEISVALWLVAGTSVPETLSAKSLATRLWVLPSHLCLHYLAGVKSTRVT